MTGRELLWAASCKLIFFYFMPKDRTMPGVQILIHIRPADLTLGFTKKLRSLCLIAANKLSDERVPGYSTQTKV